jgi:hypothetical protein
MKAIKYIGKKPERSDSVADTGLVWKPNQVHIVTDAVGERLIAHPDVWVSVPIEEAMGAGAKKPDVTDAKPKKKSTPEDDIQPTPNLRDMSLMELRKHAKSIGITLPARITEATARRKLHDEHRARNLRGRGG